MIFEDYNENPLWPILVETVHAMIMYHHHKSYVKDVTLHEKPEISPQDMASDLGLPLGEALVIIHDLKMENANQTK